MIRVLNQYFSPKIFVLILLESVLVTLALICGVRIRFWDSVTGFSAYIGLPEFLLQAGVFVVVLQLCFFYCDLYSCNGLRGKNQEWIAVGQSLGAGCLL